jgi:predicted transcriptional regulator of viral defense system
VVRPLELKPITYVRDIREAWGDDRPLRRAVRSGDSVRIHRGAFMSVDDWRSLDRDERHLHQSVAAARASRSRPTLSHASAAIVWGVPIVEHHPKVVHVLTSESAGTRSENGFRRHGTRYPELRVVEVDGTRVTDLERTLVEFVVDTSFRSGVAALDWALGSERRDGPSRTTIERIVAAAAELGIVKGRRKLRRALDFADPRSGSPGESMSRAVMHEARLPVPELQTEFRDVRGLIGFVDFWWPEFGLIGEFDGNAKYLDMKFLRGRTPAEVVIEEKRREDRLRALGPRVTRWDWMTLVGDGLPGQLRRAGLPRR